MEGNNKEEKGTECLGMAMGLCTGLLVGVVLAMVTKDAKSMIIMMTSAGGIIGYFIDEFIRGYK
ncbi:hypothetical protein [Clostridium sp. OS1-26]|uniref:hypothetical protein n=1 Tax=Clostridium sp. OS1-26 TaxID=3070681 RepID=UPI0027DEED1E|nr:hypothetical protein [Clostridium sp. OS1-26]WML33936.1 hypothetical protein RCG18_21825 [Clostridium sp. OS1-26]